MRVFLILVCLVEFGSPAKADAVSALETLTKNNELMFSYGMSLVESQPEMLLYLAASNNESNETLRSLSAQVDTIVKPGRRFKVKLSQGMIYLDSKPTDIRVVGLSPKVVLKYRGRDWAYDRAQTMDVNFASLTKFLNGRAPRSALRGLVEPSAHAEDVFTGLNPSAGWGSWSVSAVAGAVTGGAAGVMTGAAVGTSVGVVAGGVIGGTALPVWGAVPGAGLGGVVGGGVGAAVGGVAGAVTGASVAGELGTISERVTSICKFAGSSEGRAEIAKFKDVTFTCTPSSGAAADQEIALLFQSGSKQTGFRIRADRAVTKAEPPRFELGRITEAERTAIRKTLGDCAKPESLPDATKRVKEAMNRLVEAAGFCGDSKSGKAGDSASPVRR